MRQSILDSVHIVDDLGNWNIFGASNVHDRDLVEGLDLTLSELHADVSAVITEESVLKLRDQLELSGSLDITLLEVNDLEVHSLRIPPDGPVGGVGFSGTTNLSHVDALDGVFDVIHGDLVHALSVGWASVETRLLAIGDRTKIAILVVQVIRGLHLIHEVAKDVEWIMADSEGIISGETLDGRAHFLR